MGATNLAGAGCPGQFNHSPRPALGETVAALYLVGAVSGFLMAGALGMWGRPDKIGAKEVFQDHVTGAVYLLPLAAVGFLGAGWIAPSSCPVYAVHHGAWGRATAAWPGFAVVPAVGYGWLGLRNMGGRLSRIRRIHLHTAADEVDAGGGFGDLAQE